MPRNGTTCRSSLPEGLLSFVTVVTGAVVVVAHKLGEHLAAGDGVAGPGDSLVDAARG